MVTTAKTIRIDRATDDAFAEGNVKSTYSDLKEQPDGALLASSSPIHVTAAKMTAHNSPAIALYEGNARLWQDANIIEAPSIQFDRERRSLVAKGTTVHPVSTVLVQEKLAHPAIKVRSINQSSSLSVKAKIKRTKNLRKDSDRIVPLPLLRPSLPIPTPSAEAHYDGGVVARGTGFTATADEMDVYLLPRSQGIYESIT